VPGIQIIPFGRLLLQESVYKGPMGQYRSYAHQFSGIH
jgi:hypothetical protein